MSDETNTDKPKIKLGADLLSFDEIDEIEELTGLPIDSLSAGGVPKGKMFRAMAWVIVRRDQPDLTLADAGKLRVSDFDMGADETPGDAAG